MRSWASPVSQLKPSAGVDGDHVPAPATRDQPGPDGGAPPAAADGQHDRNENDEAEQDQTVRQEDGGAEQQTADEARQPAGLRTAPTQTSARPLIATPANRPSADTAIHTAPGKRATKGTSRRAAAPAPSSRSDNRQRDADRRTGQDAHGPGPNPATQPDPVQQPEHQRGQRGMTGDVGGPYGGAVDAVPEGDVVGEGRQEGPRIVDPGQVVQVLVRVEQHVRPSPVAIRR